MENYINIPQSATLVAISRKSFNLVYAVHPIYLQLVAIFHSTLKMPKIPYIKKNNKIIK
jgi:hypothetical protein